MSLIEKYLQDDVVILTLTVERLDALNSVEVSQAILSQLNDRLPRVILDLDRVGYLSSAGLRTVVQAAKHVSAYGGRFALCSVRPPVGEIISIAGFEAMMPVLASRSEALGKW